MKKSENPNCKQNFSNNLQWFVPSFVFKKTVCLICQGNHERKIIRKSCSS